MNDTAKGLTAQPVSMPVSAETMIMAAVEKGADIETLERLLAMAERIKAEQARSAYYSALSGFQSHCPEIKKTREVKGKNGGVRFRYANLDDIVKQVTPTLSKHGLSFTVKSEHKDGFVIASCEVHHIDGHSETSEFAVPVDEGSFMNDAQKMGSALSYAKRYAFTNAFGILTSDQDDDAQALGKGLSEQDLYRRFAGHMAAVMEHIETITFIKAKLGKGELSSAAEAWAEINDYRYITALSLAPTKGGCFTVAERKQMESSEFVGFLAEHRKDNPIVGM